MGKAKLGRLKWSRTLEARIVELADSGIGNNEIADIISATRSAVENRLRHIGYKRTDEQKSAVYKRAAEKHGSLPPHKTLEEREAEFAAKFDDRDELANLEYVSGYVSSDCNIKVRCKICGYEFTRWSKKLTRKKEPIVFCPHCKDNESKRLKTKRHVVLRTRKCAWCGDVFMAEGKEVYCSPCCSKEANKAQIKERNKRLGLNSCVKRAKYYGVDYELGITLDKLISRDNNRCHICGGACDKNDKQYGHVGPLYPTIDHVIPLAKGGAHTWDNVKLAHFDCNSHKSDHLESVVIYAADGGRNAERYTARTA